MLTWNAMIRRDAEWLGLALAATGLLANAAVGYFDRIFERQHCLMTPLRTVFEGERITLQALLTNAGNCHVSVTGMHLYITVGHVAHTGTSAWPETPHQPIVLAPREVQYVTFAFRYSPRHVYEADDVGEMTGPERKKVIWKLMAWVVDPSGRGSGYALPEHIVCLEELGPSGHLASSGQALHPLVLRDERSWLGVLGR